MLVFVMGLLAFRKSSSVAPLRRFNGGGCETMLHLLRRGLMEVMAEPELRWTHCWTCVRGPFLLSLKVRKNRHNQETLSSQTGPEHIDVDEEL